MPFEVVDRPLELLIPPIKVEMIQALKRNGMQIIGQVVYIDNLLISYKPLYTCIRSGGVNYFFGELTAEGIGVSYEHPAIENYAVKAAPAWKARFRNPFPEGSELYRQSWIDYVLFQTPLRKREEEQTS